MTAWMTVGGEIPQAGIDWIEGFLVVVGIVAAVLGFVALIKGMRSASKKEVAAIVEKEKCEIRRDVEIDNALKAVLDGLDRVNDSIARMRGEMGSRVGKLETQLERHDRQIIRIDQAVKSAHRRVDEHRKVDHGLPSHRSADVEDSLFDEDEM